MVQSEIVKAVRALSAKKAFVLIAIDGRCGAGKTTLAEGLKDALSCEVIHLDDFFLRPEQRSEQRLDAPGGNVDYERFTDEVLPHLLKNEEFSYRPYDCGTGKLKEPVKVLKNAVTIVEGSYSCHPKFWGAFDLHIFLDIDPDAQIERIRTRGGDEAVCAFRQKWIPLEEKYFKAFNIKENCELVFKI